ncbi:MAG TPA: c-type cytochrome [Verrucomicrobiae bacterium]|jgi:mono/diheme cytochrome c family protein|nr:c-type cytochrome [Verrucomicrobiae bacterium]
MNRQSIAATMILLATVAFALAPLYRSAVDIPIPLHHVIHAVMMAGAALAGILFAGFLARERRSGAPWLVVSMFAPVFAMLLMWPSEYSYFERHPYGHIVEHLGLIFLGFVAGYGGQRYANGIGWASGIGIVAMAVLGVWGYGVEPTTVTAVAVASSASQALGAPNVTHGSALFAQNCAICHGVGGAGGEGPPLKNERVRKSLAAAERWIENPAPPMPKLYPGTLSAQDVADVASYIETLR